MSILRQLWFALVPRYKIVEEVLLSCHEADNLVDATKNFAEHNQWHYASSERQVDAGSGNCYVVRKERIKE